MRDALPLWLVTQDGVDVALVSAVDATAARRCCNVPHVHPGGAAERVGEARPGVEGVVRWIRDPGASELAPSPRQVVLAAMRAAAAACGIPVDHLQSRAPSSVSARTGAWLALSEVMNPCAIARGSGYDHSTVYYALKKARRRLAEGDKYTRLGHDAVAALHRPQAVTC